MSFGKLLYSRVPIANNTILYTIFAKRVDLTLCSYHKKENNSSVKVGAGATLKEIMSISAAFLVIMVSWVYTYPQTQEV